MKKYVALLRGINVGGSKKVDMKKLKKVFLELGFEGVSTYINSGNVIFSSAARPEEAAVESSLNKYFGFNIPVVVRAGESIIRLAKILPTGWRNDGEQKTDVLFLRDSYDNKKSLNLIEAVPGVDNFLYARGAIVWNINRKDYGRSGMNKFIGSELYRNMTARNINTVRKFSDLLKA